MLKRVLGPAAAALFEGATVTGKEADVFGYMRRLGDGREEGNETGRIIQESQASR